VKNRTILALGASMIGGTVCPAFAQSSVMLYGQLDTGFAYANHAGNGTQSVVKAQDSILGVSTFGFRGSEDLEAGLRAIFNLQLGFNPSDGKMDNPNDPGFDRNAYVGLDGPVGTFTLGHQWDLNDDWLVGSVFTGGYNSGASFKFHEFDAISEYYNNAIKFVTRKVGGFQAAGFYSVGGAPGSFSQGSTYDIGARYMSGSLYVGGTYDQENSSSSSGAKYKLLTLGGHYIFGPVRARLGYAYADVTGPGTFQSILSQPAGHAYLVEAGADYSVTPAVTFSGDYIYRNNPTYANHTNLYRLLMSYALSTRTQLIANIAYLKNSGGATEAMYNMSDEAPGSYGGLPNSSQFAVTTGIRHSF
jgi:general bacterial porin, GBP family